MKYSLSRKNGDTPIFRLVLEGRRMEKGMQNCVKNVLYMKKENSLKYPDAAKKRDEMISLI